jgi:hypothetical protein
VIPRVGMIILFILRHLLMIGYLVRHEEHGDAILTALGRRKVVYENSGQKMFLSNLNLKNAWWVQNLPCLRSLHPPNGLWEAERRFGLLVAVVIHRLLLPLAIDNRAWAFFERI